MADAEGFMQMEKNVAYRVTKKRVENCKLLES